MAAAARVPYRLRLVNWNIAAINRNPWEYYIKCDSDPRYDELMSGIETFIDTPGDNDVAVHVVFTDAMAAELFSRMAGMDTFASSMEYVKQEWETNYRERKIVSGFMKDRGLGDKRLISMADRTTNCIDTVDGLACRPTITNNYPNPLSSLEAWWPQWMQFMFDDELVIKAGAPPQRVFNRFKPIKKAKYPAIEETEALHSLSLQTLCLAIFDAIMVNMMNTLKPGVWEEIKAELYSGLSEQKVPHCLGILEQQYSDGDIIFLQECSIKFLETFRSHLLAEKYFVVVPAAFDSEKNQNSIVLVRKEKFIENSVEEVTAAITATAGDTVSGGDMVAFTCNDTQGNEFLAVSFHGDTAGLGTPPVVKMVHDAQKESHPNATLLFGMDANAYTHKLPKKLFIDDFVSGSAALGLHTCWGDDPAAMPTSVMNARTFCQTQLNKAIRRADFVPENKAIDCNPKDHFLYDPLQVQCSEAMIDNTGNGAVNVADHDPTVIMPGMTFPSDHAIVACTVESIP